MDKPWIERMLGPSWSTTLVGLLGAPLVILTGWLATIYDSTRMMNFAAALAAVVVGAIGVLSRSQGASTQDHTKEKNDIEQLKAEIARLQSRREDPSTDIEGKAL